MGKRVLIGMSGGVDSAVSAYILQQQGYEVIAGFMKNYATEQPGCTTREDRDMAIQVAQYLGIKTFVIFDFREEYQQRIIQYIYDSYEKGLTPNPDVLCNSLVKFDIFLEQAKKMGCDYIATGHYADSEYIDGIYYLHRGVDREKDQSYFLAGLNQYQLQHVLFPLGKKKKSEVREIACQLSLPNADRKDSQGLCFIGNIPMRDFLLQRFEPKPGPIKTLDGTVVGEHQGAYLYTLGQRHGLNLSFKCYVIRIDIDTNTVYVGDREDTLLSTTIVHTQDWHWITKPYDLPKHVHVKIRYRQQPQPAVLQQGSGKGLKIVFPEQQWAVTPGQYAVAYDGEVVLGCGVIG